MFLGFWGFRFSELFSKKSIPHGSSGQTAMWKMIPYGSSSFQVFVEKCRKYLFLQIRFHFFMITLFSPFVRLRPVQAGFCVSTQTLIYCITLYAQCLLMCLCTARTMCVNRRVESPSTRTLIIHTYIHTYIYICLLYTSPSPRDGLLSRMPSSA